MKPTGYIVMETAEDFEQGLRLVTGDKYPKDGILSWRTSNSQPVAVFRTPADARAAINRTDHYRQAFGTTDPEKRFCRVTPVRMAP